MTSALILIVACLLDYILGEPKRYHPLVGFGMLANKLEQSFNRANPKSNHFNTHEQQSSQIIARISGMLCWFILTIPLPLLYYFLHQESWFFWLVDCLILCAAIGHNSLLKHARQILTPLAAGDISLARHYCSYIVSRNTSELTEQQIARATTESMLENGHDAVIASVVWFVIGGAPLAILHRLANTLDAMWGYKNPRFICFGWFAARMDDLLGWPTAKITSVLYACQGKLLPALRNARQQGQQYKSLNGGWVMAAGASVLGISLGGSASYHGKTITSVTLGAGIEVTSKDIEPSLTLVSNALLIFILSYTAFTLGLELLSWH